MKKTLTDVDGALPAQRVDARPRPDKNTDTTFGIHKRQDGQIGMGSKVVRIEGNKQILLVDDTEYKPTPGLLVLITNKHPRPDQWKPNDYQVYKSFVAQTRVRSFPNRTDGDRPHAT